MYELVRGPLVWLAFMVFIGGSIWRIVWMIQGAKREKVVIPTMNARYSLRSLAHWLVPFGTRNMRLRPLFTVVSFAFHICLLLTPLFVMGHAVLWEQSFGISWWSLPPVAADLMTVVVIIGACFFFLRRLSAPQVRNVTEWSDYVVLLIVVAPFVTGFIAHQQWLNAKAVVTLHILCGVIWLMAIPFTRLYHALTFVFTRAFMGSEFGSIRNARDY